IAPMVPSILAHLRPFFAEIQLPKLRYSLFCGEALYDDVVNEWAACAPNARIKNFYGPTEATVFAMAYECERARPHKIENGIVCIRRPMRDMAAMIVDEELRPLPSRTKGELCLAGPQLTPGYWRNPEKNREAFFRNADRTWYRTGDLAIADSDGDFFYAGRL